MVSFTKQPDGRYSARIGTVEIILEPDRFTINHYEMVTHIPCEYGPCPDGGGCKPEWRETDECPHEYQEEESTDNIMAWSFPSMQDTISGAKEQLRNRLARRQPWPDEARRFAEEVWTHQKNEPIAGT